MCCVAASSSGQPVVATAQFTSTQMAAGLPPVEIDLLSTPSKRARKEDRWDVCTHQNNTQLALEVMMLISLNPGVTIVIASTCPDISNHFISTCCSNMASCGVPYRHVVRCDKKQLVLQSGARVVISTHPDITQKADVLYVRCTRDAVKEVDANIESLPVLEESWPLFVNWACC